MLTHHYAELVSFFSRSLNDREAARDVVQESYARVMAMGQHAAVLDLRALLYRIGKNIVVDDARRKRLEMGVLETFTLLQADRAPCAERQASARQQLERLAARLAVMPRKRREAFILVRVFGFRHDEAATHLGSTVAAIEKHVVRAVLDLVALKPMPD
ncbi:MAG: sigma factor-like helix-turn-helix DNA-binding protein [Aquabacterium sp.]